MTKDVTDLTEMAAFFPVATKRQQRPTTVVLTPMHHGETPEQAQQRQAGKAARIQQQIAARKK